ncbi:uncharacterized protein PAC_01469 [Phialocephala subalpina]|uniref:Wbp11/ELF5/Saf1 N-terminal domain-containing protein n=1 Tax=Phialocephala subalpina TaxID=576137 RepID=A0A1L7WFP4_9HELO|nr:uncharacterized protein PAC_01469 [Phialocephala subalpina]
MPKEKSINPAQAQRKADKAKAIKKGKAENASRRNEKLARRNPDRLQKQLDELKEITTSGGTLTSHEKTLVESLERDLKAVKKAREALGDAAPKFGRGFGDRDGGGRGGFSGRGGRGGGVLGKRRRDGESESEEDEIPDDVKSIPMPRDTPPPIPKEVLDKWYAMRRERMVRERGPGGTNANNTPLGGNERRFSSGEGRGEEKSKPVMEARTVYEAKPAIRDLRKEAVAFVPAAVRTKLDKSKGVGGLVEPEEADRLEKAGYMSTRKEDKRSNSMEEDDNSRDQGSRVVTMEEVEDEDGQIFTYG